jgi:hypothetical protein
MAAIAAILDVLGAPSLENWISHSRRSSDIARKRKVYGCPAAQRWDFRTHKGGSPLRV